jgi:hypothetical protein
MELISSFLDFLLGMLNVDWRKITSKSRPAKAKTPSKSARRNDVIALIFCAVFIVGFFMLFSLLI